MTRRPLTCITLAALGLGALPAAGAAAPRVTTVARGLSVPWEIAFLPDGRALVTERPGRVRLLTRGGGLRRRPVARVRVSADGEGGLLGLALDPRFGRSNRFVYLYYTTASGMKLARYRFRGGRLRRDRVILGRIAAGPIHDSGRIAFGPDKRLYVATGDAGDERLPQRPRSRNGKFLRLSPRSYRGRGGRAQVFSRGHRNPQGFDWQPGTERLVSTEHGPETNDEVNVIRRGANYGWPLVDGPRHGRFAAPIATYSPSVAPSGATFVTRRGSAWTGDYLFATLVGEHIRRLEVSRRGRVTDQHVLYRGRFGRVRTVVEAPNGAIYALTSNRDGRGDPTAADDRILRFRPPRRRG
jgi:glucose/arabinose dehydrogenase